MKRVVGRGSIAKTRKGSTAAAKNGSSNAEHNSQLPEMTWAQVRWTRLLKNGLIAPHHHANVFSNPALSTRLAPPLHTPEDVASRVIGVQAQDMCAAVISVWNRLHPFTSTTTTTPTQQRPVHL
eukprot:TRINITY_DN6418_c1_g1_i2.p1 TRINITY_DN6418_c1_g1~~TRINITY_DN6418_c1_g1_i2.p1  ORF type:complete len:124 (+),score=27.69 TRINITY_DN6418_c1_g1_i2:19-390(+)